MADTPRASAPSGSDETVDAVGSGRSSNAAARGDLGSGDTIGRYIVRDRLGSGGMGTVFSALDPELDRIVAIKVLHRSDARARTRMRREAMALARLSHPNVIAIHDVGEVRDQLFVAMEFIDGLTLRQWWEETEPSPSEVLYAFVQAGRGLAAAHRTGLVHRDFKPDNVMIDAEPGGSGRSHRVRILDFGLARASTTSIDQTPAVVSASDASGTDVFSDRMTRASSVVGTPRYMAPEQYSGGEVGPAADQFSFCVALHEILLSQYPFDGDNAVSLLVAARKGLQSPPELPAGVPRSVGRAIARGLSPQPEDRWPSMDELLAQLQPKRSTTKWAGIVGGAGVLAGTVMWGYGPDADRCASADERIAHVWNKAVASELERDFAATGLEHADETWRRVETRVDAWAESWGTAVTEACRSAEGGEQGEDPGLDHRTACFNRQLAHLEAVTTALSKPDRALINRSVDMVLGLPDPERCADADEHEPVDPSRAAEVDFLFSELARCWVLESSGKMPDFEQCAEQNLERARELEYEPLVLKARSLRALALTRRGRLEEAAKFYEALYFDAKAADNEVLAHGVARQLVFLHARLDDTPDEARRWLGFVTQNELTDKGAADVRRLEAVVAHSEGDFERAATLAREAVRFAEVSGEQRRLGFALNLLGNSLDSAGKHVEAAEAYERSLQVRIELTGEVHPFVATNLNNLGSQHLAAGRVDEALRYYERALKIRRIVLPHDHFHIATVTGNIGNALNQLHRFEEALRYHREAAIVFAVSKGPDNARYGEALVRIGLDLQSLGRRDEAERFIESGFRIAEAALGPSALHLVSLRSNLLQFQADDITQDEATRAYDALLERLKGVDRSKPVWRGVHEQIISAASKRGFCDYVVELSTTVDLAAMRKHRPGSWAKTLSGIGTCHAAVGNDTEVAEIRGKLQAAIDEVPADAIETVREFVANSVQ